MLGIPLQFNNSLKETTQPINPLTISSATLSSTNPNGTLIIDTTQAVQQMTSTITVTATDTLNGTKRTQTFGVSVGAYSGPTDPAINFRPYANSTVAEVTPNTATSVKLNGASGYPDSSRPSTAYLLAFGSARSRQDHQLQPVNRFIDVYAQPGIQRSGLDPIPGYGDGAGDDARNHGQ